MAHSKAVAGRDAVKCWFCNLLSSISCRQSPVVNLLSSTKMAAPALFISADIHYTLARAIWRKKFPHKLQSFMMGCRCNCACSGHRRRRRVTALTDDLAAPKSPAFAAVSWHVTSLCLADRFRNADHLGFPAPMTAAAMQTLAAMSSSRPQTATAFRQQDFCRNLRHIMARYAFLWIAIYRPSYVNYVVINSFVLYCMWSTPFSLGVWFIHKLYARNLHPCNKAKNRAGCMHLMRFKNTLTSSHTVLLSWNTLHTH